MANTPTGTTFFIASSIASAKATTVASNATSCVLTSAAHGYSANDFVIVESGWGRLNKRAFRLSAVTTDTMTLEGMDTSSTTYFPADTGIGTVRKISTFTQILTVMNPQSSGGDPKTVSYKYTESDVDYNINNGFTATNYSFDIDADYIGTAGYTLLKSLTDGQQDTVLKVVMRSGSFLLQPCRLALNEAPKMTDGQIMTNAVQFTGNNVNTRYAS